MRKRRLFFNLANHLWQSTLVVVVIGLLTLLVRENSPRLRYGLWLAASLKFLVPYALLTALIAHIPWRTGGDMTPQLVHLVDRVTTPLVPAASAGPILPMATPWGLGSGTLLALAAVWAGGILALFIRWLLRWHGIQQALQASKPISVDFPFPVRSSKVLLEPGVVGVIHPVLLLPDGIEEKLSAEQLRAVLTHELCHVTRRDNLTATIHMIVEALFWFYPLIWWIGARLIEERERACDEEVLRTGNTPAAYAAAILRICQFYLEAPLICASGLGGASLRTRIELIMKNKSHRRLSGIKKLLLALAAVAVLSTPLVLGLASPVPVSVHAPDQGDTELRKPPPDQNQSPSLGQRIESLLEERYPRLMREKVQGTPVVNVLYRQDGTVAYSSHEIFDGPSKDFSLTADYFGGRLGLAAEEVAYLGLQTVTAPLTGEKILVAFTERKRPGQTYVSKVFAPDHDGSAIDRALVGRFFADTLKRGVPAEGRLWVLFDDQGHVLRTAEDSSGGQDLSYALKMRFPGVDAQFITVTGVTDSSQHPVNDLSGKPLQLSCVWLKKGSSVPGVTLTARAASRRQTV